MEKRKGNEVEYERRRKKSEEHELKYSKSSKKW